MFYFTFFVANFNEINYPFILASWVAKGPRGPSAGHIYYYIKQIWRSIQYTLDYSLLKNTATDIQ